MRKPHCSRRLPACRAQSRSPPGGLMVSNARSSRVRATASFALMSNHTSSLSRAVYAARPDDCTFCKVREKALAILADHGDTDRPLLAGERTVGDHVER